MSEMKSGQPFALCPMDPADAALADWEAQRPRWEELQNRPLPDGAALARWIADWSALNEIVWEIADRLQISLNCDTEDADKQSAYLNYTEQTTQKVTAATDLLNRKLLACPAASALPADQGKWLESVRAGVELFCEENLPLHAELSRLVQDYEKIQGAQKLEWEGQTRTLLWMEALLQEPDRGLRERAWRSIAERRLQDRDSIDVIFDRMVELRGRIAANLNLPDYVAYAFKNNLRTDYSPADCFRFHSAVEQAAVPVHQEILAARRETLKLDKLRPWDLNCDPKGRPPLKPFQTIGQLTEKTACIFARVDPALAAMFALLQERGLMDLDNRVGKAPGGYMAPLSKTRLPFIYLNAVGIHRNVMSLLHESGHAFHFFLARDLPLAFNRTACFEFCEVASMSMERLGARHLAEFYEPDDRQRALRIQNEDVPRLLSEIAAIDAFQHRLYTTRHTPAQRHVRWAELDGRYSPDIDWSGLEDYRGTFWHRVPHFFNAPFYYIEYGIARIGSLQVWKKSQEDPAEALRLYKHALSLGGTMGLKDLFAAAGLRFGMDEETLRPLLEKVREEWRVALS
jgi:oligoendopeptidase F